MCGRFAFYSPSEATAALFGVDGSLAVEPRYNIAPTQYVAALRNDEHGQRELAMLRWGLVPSWAKDPAIGNRMINARAETVAEKPSFRSAYKHRRCVILADGYYEWSREGATKTPYFISLADSRPFALAGLWESWTDRDSGDTLQTATLITMEANDFLQPLHHRMPIITQPDNVSAWLNGSMDYLDSALVNTPQLQAWPVSKRVNNARNEGDDLVEVDGEVRR